MVKVKLLSKTEKPEQMIWLAARNCYSQKCACELAQEIDKEIPDDFPRLFNDLYRSGHWSVFEHVQFVFEIEGFSRVAQQQLTRHRFLQWSIQSMRYTSFEDADFHLPEPKTAMEREKLNNYVKHAKAVYTFFVNNDHEKEKARLLLMLGTKSNAVMSGNLRALIDIAGVRRCVLAQQEAMNIFNQVRQRVLEVNRYMGRAMMIKCQRLGYCPEMRNVDNELCTIRPHVDSLDLNILSILDRRDQHD